MRALVADPAAESRVRMAEVPEPRPRPDQLVVQVGHIGLNLGEFIPGAWTAGVIHGHDAAGVVVEPARDGGGAAPGTPVVLGLTPHAWAERVAVPVQALAPIPRAVDPAAAAALPVAGVAALRVVRSRSLLGRRVHTVGFASGQPTVFPTGSLFGLDAPPKMIVTTAGSDDHIADELETLLDLVARRRLSPQIGWRDTWERVDEAAAARRDRRISGKIVLEVDGTARRQGRQLGSPM